MKIYHLCEFLRSEDIYIIKNGRLLMHLVGEDAVKVTAAVYEHCNVVTIRPTNRAVEITIE